MDRKKGKKGKEKNVIIRVIEVKEGRRKEAVEEIMKIIGVELKVDKVWKIAGERKIERETVGIRMEKKEKKERYGRKKRH